MMNNANKFDDHEDPECYLAHLECGGEHYRKPEPKPSDLAGIIAAVVKAAAEGDDVCQRALAQLIAAGKCNPELRAAGVSV